MDPPLVLQVHSLRDHPNHDRPLNGGMWGGVKSAVPDMAALIKGWSNRNKVQAWIEPNGP